MMKTRSQRDLLVCQKTAFSRLLCSHVEAEVISKLCALAVPILGSIFLLISFYCFDSFQFVVFHKISLGMFGRYSTAEIVSLFTSLTLPWLITGHWLLLDALAVGLSVSFITLVRLPTLKISSFAINTSSPAVHVLDEKEIPAAENTSVVLYVASKSAENPIAVVSRNFDLIRLISDPPKLSLPANLVFSSLNDVGRFTILRLGDMVAATTYAIRQPSYRRYFR
ncbi:signal peptide peptidase [Trichuris suis]|nr:signal peptide peptidase [Trichuris suis]